MASRKSSSRNRQKPTKPAVIDATATEVDAESTEAVVGEKASASNNDTAMAGETASEGSTAAGDTSNMADGSIVSEPDTQSSDNAERDDRETVAAPPGRSPGNGKWIAAGLAAVLLTGVAGGGYLYRTYGQQLFGTAGSTEMMAALENQVMDASGAAQSAREAAEAAAARLDGLSQRMDGLERALAEASSKPDQAVTEEIGKARQAADAAQSVTETLAGKTTGLEGRIDELQGAVQSLQKALDNAAKSGGGTEQAAVSVKLEELARKVDAVEAGASKAMAPDTAEMESLKQQLADNGKTITALQEQLSALTSQLDAATGKLEQAAQSATDNSNLAAIGQDMDALANAVNAGTPFKAELDRLREQASLPALPALSENAQAGIKTVAQLDAELSAIGSGLQSKAQPAPAEADGLWGLVQSKISSVVKVRSLDETDWASQISQARLALTSGGLDAAIASLPGQAADMPSDLAQWLIEARKRVAAQAELERLPQALMSAAPSAGQSQ